MKATWNGAVIADSDHTVVVEGNHYFPHDSVNWDLLTATDTHTVCPWKGTASYWTVVVDGQSNPDAVWAYPHPKRLFAFGCGRVVTQGGSWPC